MYEYIVHWAVFDFFFYERFFFLSAVLYEDEGSKPRGTKINRLLFFTSLPCLDKRNKNVFYPQTFIRCLYISGEALNPAYYTFYLYRMPKMSRKSIKFTL
jgi:hypothetical protein